MRMSCAIYNTLENRLLASIEKHQDNNHTKSKIGKNPVSNFNESIPVTIKSEDPYYSARNHTKNLKWKKTHEPIT